jgi:hypothetical protein
MNIHDVDASDSTESTGLAYTDRLGDYPPLERVWEDVEMNINGHEIEIIDGNEESWYTVDGYTEWSTKTRESVIAGFVSAYKGRIGRAEALIEYRRREAVEKAELDAERELDRRAKIVADAWYATSSDYVHPDYVLIAARNVVRALDADAAEKAT